jgi:hypothetical protein
MIKHRSPRSNADLNSDKNAPSQTMIQRLDDITPSHRFPHRFSKIQTRNAAIMTITTMPTISPQKGKNEMPNQSEERNAPMTIKNTDQSQIKTPASASAASFNQDYCACTQSTRSTTV